jgi:dCMP deaminase
MELEAMLARLQAKPGIHWAERMMMLADFWALFSTCTKRAVGAVVVDEDFQVLVSGFNGAPRKAKHCRDQEHPLVDADGHCLYCLHAEGTCGNQATRLGIRLHGGIMFCLYRPCIRCATTMVQWGLKRLYFRDAYLGDPFEAESLSLLVAGGTSVAKLAWTPRQEAFRTALELYRQLAA